MNRKASHQGIEIDNPLTDPVEFEDDKTSSLQREKAKKNTKIFWWVVLVIILILLFRLFFLQIVKGDHYKKVAEENRTRSKIIKAPRGLILDSKGEILAKNIPSFDIIFVPSDLPGSYNERMKIYSKLAKEIEMNQAGLESQIESIDRNKTKGYLIKTGIDYEKALILVERIGNLEGIYLEKTARREYPDSKVFSSLIGYTGKISQEELDNHPAYLLTDYIGKNGLEYAYEKWLKGKHGQYKMEVDSSGNVKEDLGMQPPVPGSNLVLNIDAGLQRKVYDALGKVIEKNEDSTGAAAVALDPRDGGVLALVSMPSFDNNKFAKGISQEDYQNFLNDPGNPLMNRAVSGAYPPGSTFKPIVAAAGLEEKVIDENTTIDCPGSISVGEWSYNDWKTHGKTNLKKAIAESCNVFFYSVGGGWGNISGLGINQLSKYAKYFGLGQILGIDIPWEAKGAVPDKEWKHKNFGEKWYIGDSYHTAIGQGFVSATPLQMASSIAAIANEGKLFRPQVADKLIAPETEENDIKPELIGEGFISRENLRIVKEGMKETIISGSGRRLNDMETPVAGKTGTAQYGSQEKTHSWFVSFAPVEKPEIALAVIIEGGGEGHDWAVPASEKILRYYFKEKEEENYLEDIKKADEEQEEADNPSETTEDN